MSDCAMNVDPFDPIAEELHLMKTAGIVEVASRNASVMDYIRHWEGRTEKAESALSEAQATIARQQVMLDRALEDNGGMMAEIVRLRGALDDIYRHVDWWSTWRISSHIRAALSRPHATKGDEG